LTILTKYDEIKIVDQTFAWNDCLMIRIKTVFYMPKSIGNNTQKLIFLEISQSKMKAISSTSLENYKNLEYLNLQENMIRILGENLFQNNKNLDEIILSYNQIFVIAHSAFEHLKRLKILDLKNNICISNTTNNEKEAKSVIHWMQTSCTIHDNKLSIISQTEDKINEIEIIFLIKNNELIERIGDIEIWTNSSQISQKAQLEDHKNLSSQIQKLNDENNAMKKLNEDFKSDTQKIQNNFQTELKTLQEHEKAALNKSKLFKTNVTIKIGNLEKLNSNLIEKLEKLILEKNETLRKMSLKFTELEKDSSKYVKWIVVLVSINVILLIFLTTLIIYVFNFPKSTNNAKIIKATANYDEITQAANILKLNELNLEPIYASAEFGTSTYNEQEEYAEIQELPNDDVINLPTTICEDFYSQAIDADETRMNNIEQFDDSSDNYAKTYKA